MTKDFTMPIASKRQLTIPQELLDLLCLREGDSIRIVAEEGQILKAEALALLPTRFFSPEVLRMLNEREEQIEAGHFREFRDLSELPKKRKTEKVRAAGAERE